jgi:hypothetical protein
MQLSELGMSDGFLEEYSTYTRERNQVHSELAKVTKQTIVRIQNWLCARIYIPVELPWEAKTGANTTHDLRNKL